MNVYTKTARTKAVLSFSAPTLTTAEKVLADLPDLVLGMIFTNTHSSDLS
jgi:hypothetical protein